MYQSTTQSSYLKDFSVFPKVQGLIFLFLVLVFGLPAFSQNCYHNLIPDPSFEDAAPLPSSPYSPGRLLTPGGWYNVARTADIMNSSGPMPSSPVKQAADGDIWIGIVGQSGGGNEGIANAFSKPLEVGKNYKLSFWAAADRKAKLEIYLSDYFGKIENSAIPAYTLIEKVKIKKKEWKKYEFRFTANKSFKQIFFHNPYSPGFLSFGPIAKYIVLDNIELTEEIQNCCYLNLLSDGDFEDNTNGWGPWKSIDRNCIYNIENTSRSSFLGPINYSSGSNDNNNWGVLCSFIANGVLPSNKENQAITIKLDQPMLVGQWYVVKFQGATKNNLARGRGEINMKLWTSSYCPGTNCDNYWNSNIGGTPVFQDFKLQGKTKKWHNYETFFGADKPYNYLVIQARGGHNIAIDNVCISAEPFLIKIEEPILYYNTYNSVRQVSATLSTKTVDYLSNYDLFGLRLKTDKLYVENNKAEIHDLKPLYTSHQSNPKNEIALQNESTDIVFDGNDKGYCAINYSVKKVNSLSPSDPSTNLSPFPQASLVAAPFSLAISGNYLFVLGANQLSVTNLTTNNSKLINNHGIIMGAFMDFDDNQNLYIADPGTDAIRKISSTSIAQIKTDLDANLPIATSSTILTQGNLLVGTAPGSPDVLIRGPIGLDFHNGTIWVTVDSGSGVPGNICEIDPSTGVQTLFLSNVPGPRAIQLK